MILCSNPMWKFLGLRLCHGPEFELVLVRDHYKVSFGLHILQVCTLSRISVTTRGRTMKSTYLG